MFNKQALNIIMGDLTHDTVVLVSDTIPINIGFVASYAKKIYGSDIDVSLYKYPDTIIEAIKTKPPDILALSNYSWNSRLSERICEITKAYNPHCVTVQGGTNFPHQAPLQRDFLIERPHTDFHIELEGEVAFAELIRRTLATRDGATGMFDAPVSGSVFIQPESRMTRNPTLITGDRPDRLKALDNIPSPYLNGMLDHFFDGRLTPFLETNRGCPFTCSFCHTGNNYFNKINNFSLDRVKEEIRYIAPKVSVHKIVNLHIADTNFGMYQRDSEICEVLLQSQQRYGWPLQIMATTGKNNKERVIDITKMMGNTFSVNMSVQSMNPVVLKNINRENIKLDHYMAINKVLTEAGRSTKGEVIIGLPGETCETFTSGVESIINAGVSSVCSYSLMLLHGTLFKEPAYRNKFDIKGKYRIVPLNFGDYDGIKVFDIEETGIENKDMSFNDYLWIRGLSLMVEVMYNSRPFHEFFLYVSNYGFTLFDFIKHVYNGLLSAPLNVQQIVKDFLDETRSELWNSEDELIAHYRNEENYDKLKRGEVGGNLIYKYKAISLAHYSGDWISFLSQNSKTIIKEKIADPVELEKIYKDIDLLVEFTRNKLMGVLNVSGDLTPKTMECPYDIIGWKKKPACTPLSDYKLTSPVFYTFVYTDEQLRARDDQFKRYGSHANGLSKIVTRVSNVESLFRKIYIGDRNQEEQKKEIDLFIRYTLSN